MKLKLTSLLLLGLIFNFGFAQNEILLWSQGIPGGIDTKEVEEFKSGDKNGEILRIHQVVTPSLKVYLAPQEKATGAAVLICPGGGYKILAIDHEGYQVAEWLNSIGISAFVLKYRLPDDRIMEDKKVGPLQDAQKALRMIRENATAWGLQPDKIGVMGFSAGGHLAATLSTQYNKVVYPKENTISARPDFSILVYPVISMKNGLTHAGSRTNLLGNSPAQTTVEEFSNELQVDENTPPTLLIHSLDDLAVPVENSMVYLEKLKEHKVFSEMHAFSDGGHGYGLGRGGSQEFWSKNAENWLKIILKK